MLIKLKTLAAYGAHPREKEIEKGREHGDESNYYFFPKPLKTLLSSE